MTLSVAQAIAAYRNDVGWDQCVHHSIYICRNLGHLGPLLIILIIVTATEDHVALKIHSTLRSSAHYRTNTLSLDQLQLSLPFVSQFVSFIALPVGQKRRALPMADFLCQLAIFAE
jgi:hypothetical protein